MADDSTSKTNLTSLASTPRTLHPNLTHRPTLSPRGSYKRTSSFQYPRGQQRPGYYRSASSRSYRQSSTSTSKQRPVFQRAISSRRKVQFPFRFIIARSLRKGAGSLNLNELLIYHSKSSFAPLEFDLSLDPSHILICYPESKGSYSRLTVDHLVTPATTPQLPRLYISCPLLPWTPEIQPVHNGRFVTVGDIISGLFRCLRAHASAGDWESLPKEGQRRVRNAWRRRYKRQASFEEREYEERQGLRRVDFLEGNLCFRGLSPGNSMEHWVMHVGPMKKRVKFTAGS